MPTNQHGKQYSLRLFTQADIGFEIGVSGGRIWQLDKEGFLPQPYAVVGYNGARTTQIQKLYSASQVKEIVEAFKKRKEEKHPNGVSKDKLPKPPRAKPGPKPKPKVEKEKPVTTRSITKDTMDTLGTECPDCGDWVFNLAVHQDFAHKNKLGKVGARS